MKIRLYVLDNGGNSNDDDDDDDDSEIDDNSYSDNDTCMIVCRKYWLC